jgi:NADPH:quinone reductase
MRVVIADHPGPPDVLHAVTIPDPLPGAGQVRVVVEVAAISFVDTLIRSGSSIAPSATFPLVLGNGVGGVVDGVGTGVDPVWIGSRVVAATGGTGGYSELALANVADLHRLPDPLDFLAGAALLADGRTAVGLHRAARIQAGETVAVTAAAGGVGGILVQLAKSSGARVIALAGSAIKLDHARDLGAAVALNYRDRDWVDRLRASAPDGVDVVFDGVGGAMTEALFPVVRRAGRYLPHGAAGGRWGSIDSASAGKKRIAVIPLSEVGTAPNAQFSLTEHALDLAVHGRIRPTIGQTFPLADAASAHSAIELRTTIGKTLLLP